MDPRFNQAKHQRDLEEAHIEELDHYLDVFYEENIEAKVFASRKILLLVLDHNNMEYLLTHGKSWF